jgi:hypothetical protein
VLFAVATLFIFLVLLHYSTVISRLTDENVDLASGSRCSRSGSAGSAHLHGGLKANTSPELGSSAQFVPTPMR